jgi:hypothetical protein
MSVVPVGRPRRPKPLERSARNAGRVPLERHVRRSTTEVAGSLPRRARDGLPGHAALDPPNRSRKMPRTATPGRVPGNGAEGTSPSETEAAESVAHPRPNGCSTTSTASPTPTEAGTNSTTAALERVPDCRRHVAPAAETVEVPRQLRSDGCPIAAVTSPPRPKPWRSRDSCARTGARWSSVLHPARPKPRGDRRQLHPDWVPDCRRHVAPAAETVEVPRQLRSDGCPIAAATSPPQPKPWRSRDSCARTGAQVPMALHPTQPKLDGDPCRRRSDGCPRAEGALPWAAEAARGAARPRPNRCPFADAASPSATEAAERGATSTPGRVPSCRR